MFSFSFGSCGSSQKFIISKKVTKVWNFPGNENNRFIWAASNIIKVVYDKNGQRSYPSVDTLYYFLSEIKSAGYNVFVANLTPSDENQEQDKYYFNLMEALKRVNNNETQPTLRCMIYDRRFRDKSIEQFIPIVRKYYSEKYFYGFYVDEPRESEFDKLSEWIIYLKNLKTNDALGSKLFFVNLYGISSQDDYIDYVNSWIEKEPTIIAYDNYAVWDDKTASQFGDNINYDWGKDFFLNLEIFRTISVNNNLPFCNWILVHKHYSNYSKKYYRRATPADLNFQIYSSLAYGAKGIFYYNFWNPPMTINKNGWNEEEGVLKADGKETELYSAIKDIQSKTNKIANILLDLTNTGVFHFDKYYPNSKVALETDYNVNAEDFKENYGVKVFSSKDKEKSNNDFIKSIDNKSGFISYFKDKNNNQYFMIVNKDRKSSQTFSIQIKDELLNENFKLVGLNDDSIILQGKNKNSFTFTLEQGCGKLFKMENKIY